MNWTGDLDQWRLEMVPFREKSVKRPVPGEQAEAMVFERDPLQPWDEEA